jgi:plastocyanin
MRRLAPVIVGLVFVANGCVGGGTQARTVLVDHEEDQFATSMLAYFPDSIDARPGDTIVFRQTWTGEPHSVTMGTEVDKLGKLVKPFVKLFKKSGYEGLPDPPPKPIQKLENRLPWMTDDNGNTAQNGAQPCFLRRSLPPKKESKSCTKAQQQQPAFNGRYKYYNSGFIPYQGSGSNTYTVKIAADAKPGAHYFYCNYHGEFMSGYLHIKPKGAKVATQSQLTARAQREIDVFTRPLLKAYRDAQRERYPIPDSAAADAKRLGVARTHNGKLYAHAWLAGVGSEKSGITDNSQIDEFVPKRLHAKVGHPLTWVVIGQHTLSFNVPTYFPIIQVLKDGTVKRNPKIAPPAGGAPKIPTSNVHGALAIDGGSWDGRGFWSSGLMDYQSSFTKYSLRITKPGTYKFACLIHPPMVGTITITR